MGKSVWYCLCESRCILNGDKTAGGQVGFRYPYYLTGTDKNGYYIGFYAGHLDSKEVDGDFKSRLGAGVDLAYVWLNSEKLALLVWVSVRLKN